MNKKAREHLEYLLERVVNRNGGIENLKQYYQEQGLTEERMHNDLWLQVPPLERNQLPVVTDNDIKQYFKKI